MSSLSCNHRDSLCLESSPEYLSDTRLLHFARSVGLAAAGAEGACWDWASASECVDGWVDTGVVGELFCAHPAQWLA